MFYWYTLNSIPLFCEFFADFSLLFAVMWRSWSPLQSVLRWLPGQGKVWQPRLMKRAPKRAPDCDWSASKFPRPRRDPPERRRPETHADGHPNGDAYDSRGCSNSRGPTSGWGSTQTRSFTPQNKILHRSVLIEDDQSATRATTSWVCASSDSDGGSCRRMSVSLSSVALPTERVPLSAPGGPPERSALSASVQQGAVPRTPCTPIPGIGRFIYVYIFLYTFFFFSFFNPYCHESSYGHIRIYIYRYIYSALLHCINSSKHFLNKVCDVVRRHAPTRSSTSQTHSAQRQRSYGPSHRVPGRWWTPEQVRSVCLFALTGLPVYCVSTRGRCSVTIGPTSVPAFVWRGRLIGDEGIWLCSIVVGCLLQIRPHLPAVFLSQRHGPERRVWISG